MFTFYINNSITISSELLESDVSIIPDVKVHDIKNGYIWYTLPPFEINGESTIFNLCFFNKKLQSLNISISNKEKYGGGWSEFSEAKESLRAKATEKLLYGLGYRTGKFPWGEIWCGYDAKSGLGHAVVRYAL
ncbi:hypothetical protein [Vibrio nigripulchritudo]|uniref:hypothetical protein n=1 Tax=Vibrio nigripulchritudo TaxID=28173 RepID=UPI00249096EE|nr:hypothetical protein [Vibrio nigripulchritudo]BDU39599.1 hypothetical protein TUMSATVNIG2_40680 [Vibrio nigripulchritudo]BDU45320.1 hypothetical protein TUMSATVNIG3_41180 [Vibrio nigripulchritudo]